MRIDTASYPATTHTHTESHESDRRNKKGDRIGDGNYLSVSAVLLEYRKSEQVKEKLRGCNRETMRKRKVLKVHIYRMMILERFFIDYTRENDSSDGLVFWPCINL